MVVCFWFCRNLRLQKQVSFSENISVTFTEHSDGDSSEKSGQSGLLSDPESEKSRPKIDRSTKHHRSAKRVSSSHFIFIPVPIQQRSQNGSTLYGSIANRKECTRINLKSPRQRYMMTDSDKKCLGKVVAFFAITLLVLLILGVFGYF